MNNEAVEKCILFVDYCSNTNLKEEKTKKLFQIKSLLTCLVRKLNFF